MSALSPRASFALLLPFFGIMILFFTMPLLLILVYSFLTPGNSSEVEWLFSTESYLRLFWDQDFDGNWSFHWGYIKIFLRSVKLAVVSTILCFILGFPTAFYMASRSKAQQNLWIFLITIPCWTNLMIRTYAWILILRTEGVLNQIFMQIGLVQKPIEFLYTDFAVGIGLIASYLPFMVLPIFANLERMNWRFIEAAEDLYANKWQVLRHVILPLSWPGIASGSCLVFIPALGSFLAPTLLGGNKELMIGNAIEMQFGSSRDWPLGSAYSVVLMILVFVGLVCLRRSPSLRS